MFKHLTRWGENEALIRIPPLFVYSFTAVYLNKFNDCHTNANCLTNVINRKGTLITH